MAKRAKPIAANDDRLKLIEALKFAAIAAKDNDGNANFVSFSDHWLSAENDTFSVGINVDVELELCPHSEQFQAALQQCGQQFQLTQLDMGSVSIRSGNFRATVPARLQDLMSPFNPDPPVALINDRLREGFAACLRIMTKGERICHNSLLLRANNIVATNYHAAIEYWHGIDLPGPLNIPKKTAETIIKIGKPLAQLGFSSQSVTFYFNDASFIKTRLIAGEWPDIDLLLAKPVGPFVDIWRGFYDGLKAIDAFIQGDCIFFHADYIASHQTLEIGANFRVDGLPPSRVFTASYWRAIEPFARAVYIAPEREPFAFIGDNVRGLIMGRTA